MYHFSARLVTQLFLSIFYPIPRRIFCPPLYQKWYTRHERVKFIVILSKSIIFYYLFIYMLSVEHDNSNILLVRIIWNVQFSVDYARFVGHIQKWLPQVHSSYGYSDSLESPFTNDITSPVVRDWKAFHQHWVKLTATCDQSCILCTLQNVTESFYIQRPGAEVDYAHEVKYVL